MVTKQAFLYNTCKKELTSQYNYLSERENFRTGLTHIKKGITESFQQGLSNLRTIDDINLFLATRFPRMSL